MLRVLLLALCVGVAAPLGAQSPTATSLFTARILDARTERPIAQASILLPALERTARSDSLGNLRLTQLPAGKHVALVQAIGYDSLLFAIDVAQSDTAEAELMLTPIAQQLEKVKVEATGGMMAARMAEYEDRKKVGLGTFLDSTVFQQVRGLPLADVLSARLGVTRRGKVAKSVSCIILDGMPMRGYDLNLIPPESIAAVEVHTIASAPQQYQGTNGCGMLIVWRKLR